MGGAGRWQRNATGDPPQALPQRRLLSVDYSRLHPCGRAGVEGRSGFLSRRNVGTGNLGCQTAAGYSQRADRARGRRYAPQRHTSSFRRARATANRLLCGLLAQIQEEHAVRPVSENGITDRHWRHRRRMSVSGPRPNGSYGSGWSLNGAEAVLRLRALRTSGDFDAYWRFHEEQEYLRNHVALYAGGQVAPIRSRAKKHLKRIK